MKTKILVCCHKKGDFPSDNIYIPIHCGKAISNVELNIQEDNRGDNISSKNPNYCELTALYWAWKNLKNVNYIGLVHYRRFFDFSSRFVEKEISYVNEYQLIGERINNQKEFVSIFCKYDIILPKRKVFASNLKKDYCSKHIPEEYEILRNVIKRLFPDYLGSFDYIMNQTNKASCYNMFITRETVFDSYCSWLFTILFAVEKEIKISEYPYQARVFGFMSERLINIYCYHHSLRILYKPILLVDPDKSVPYYKYMLNNLRCEISFFLSLKK